MSLCPGARIRNSGAIRWALQLMGEKNTKYTSPGESGTSVGAERARNRRSRALNATSGVFNSRIWPLASSRVRCAIYLLLTCSPSQPQPPIAIVPLSPLVTNVITHAYDPESLSIAMVVLICDDLASVLNGHTWLYFGVGRCWRSSEREGKGSEEVDSETETKFQNVWRNQKFHFTFLNVCHIHICIMCFAYTCTHIH